MTCDPGDFSATETPVFPSSILFSAPSVPALSSKSAGTYGQSGLTAVTDMASCLTVRDVTYGIAMTAHACVQSIRSKSKFYQAHILDMPTIMRNGRYSP